MADEAYTQLAPVYEWLLDDAIITPEGQVAAFAPLLDALPPGARVLDCAAGTGLLAVGLLLRGFDATASDLSAAMLVRARSLAAERGVALETVQCAWDDLTAQGWEARFDAVFCVGNSLGHVRERVRSLRAIAATLNPGGQLVLTSRNWEREGLEQPRVLEIEAAGVRERLTYWPFTYAELKADLVAADLEVVHSTYSIDAERYLVAARV